MITVFGLGFVGITTALGFAEYGYKVYGIDPDEEKKAVLRRGKLPFMEDALQKPLQELLNQRFFITEDVENAIKESDIIFYCVGTPYGENGEADLTYLFRAIETTLKYIQKSKRQLLVVKSTIPPSTTAGRVIPFIEEKGFSTGRDLLIANNPEFLREGKCWEDFIHADRIVVGCENEEAAERMKNLYEPFQIPVCLVSYSTGEFIKYLSNTLLATMISYSNEMANIARKLGGIDIAKAFHILHMDKRWNGCDMTGYVYPGCGYGGYCLPKDTNALLSVAKENGAEAGILENVIALNDKMPSIIAADIIGNTKPETAIGILGLSFKPGSDDVRDCASYKIILKLLEKGYHHILAYDPAAVKEFKRVYRLELEYTEDMDEIVDKAECLVILTAWEAFKDFDSMGKTVLDYRYVREENNDRNN